MNVVVRGLMAAGMGVYATLHALQAARGDAPSWTTVAFGAAALVALGLVVALIAVGHRVEGHIEDASAALALLSALALTATLTVGFFGVEDVLRVESIMAYVAEGVVLLAWVAGRFSPQSTMETTTDNASRENAEPAT